MTTANQRRISGTRVLWYLVAFGVFSIALIGGTVAVLHQLGYVSRNKTIETSIDVSVAREQRMEIEYRNALDHTAISQKDFQAIYRAGEISGVPWQTLAALFFDESTNGTNVGRYTANQVLSGAQYQAFKRICRQNGLNANWAKVAGGGEMGPFQFMPLTWAEFGIDADGDGKINPYSTADAAATAGRYLVYRGYHQIPWNAVRSYKGGTKGHQNAEVFTNRVMRLASNMGAPLDL